jgi:small-conductance mechanosensitive channel
VTSLATGFGVVGIAVAFAFQSILKDLFSYFTILLDRPVDVGDYINANGKSGTVSKIGIKTTRLKALNGEEIVVPNASLTESNIDKYGKAKYRRVVTLVKVPLETEVVVIKKLKNELEKIINSFENNKLSRCYLKNITDQALEIEIVYKISPRDYSIYIETKEKVNFAILEYFEKEKIMFAYPAEIMINKEAGDFPGYYMNEKGEVVKK